MIIFLGSIQVVVLNFLALIGSFTLWSWVEFQVHCLKLARQYQKAKIEHGHGHIGLVEAFWRMKKHYQNHIVNNVTFTFEKPKDEDVK